MKIVLHGITNVFDTDNDYINTVVIEKQSLFTEICEDIYQQIMGTDGKSIVSINDKPLEMSKNVDLLMQFVPFEMNRKSLISKLISKAELISTDADYYETTMTELANLENYLWKITENMEGNISFSKLTIGSVIKAVGMEFEDDYNSIGEKVIDYMELVREYDKDKLFVMVNFRSFIDDDECNNFFETILRKKFNVIIIDNCEHTLCSNEKRCIIDSDYCEIM